MKITLFSLIAFTTVLATAQSAENIVSAFPGSLEGYETKTDFEVKTLNDGTIRVTRKYTSSGLELSIKLSASSDENLDKNLSDIGELMSMFDEMSEKGIMKIERDQGLYHSGIFTYISKDKVVVGGLFLVKDRYLLEIEIIGGTQMDDARRVFDQFDLSKLN